MEEIQDCPSELRKAPRMPRRPSVRVGAGTDTRSSARKTDQARAPPTDIPMEVGPGEEFQAQQVYDRPYRASYFVPGKVEGRPAQFLLDTGCTTNLLARHVFDRLPERIRSQRQDYASYGLLADGTRLPFFGMVRLSIRLRQVKLEETFVVSQISEDAILGMPFLVEQGCSMDFTKPVIHLGEQEIKCTD